MAKKCFKLTNLGCDSVTRIFFVCAETITSIPGGFCGGRIIIVDNAAPDPGPNGSVLSYTLEEVSCGQCNNCAGCNDVPGTGGGSGGGTGGTGGGLQGVVLDNTTFTLGNNKRTENGRPPLNIIASGNVIYNSKNTVLTGAQFNAKFQPYLGQRLTVRETLIMNLQMGLPKLEYGILDRVVPYALAGQYQQLYQLDDGRVTVLSEEKIHASLAVVDQPFATISRDFDFYMVANKGDTIGATLGQLENCNAELAPALVGNTNFDATSAAAYAALQIALTGNPNNASAVAATLLSPALPGYKFPINKPLFTNRNQIKVVDFDSALYTVGLRSSGIFLYPGWSLLSIAHQFEVINFDISPNEPNQLKNPYTCNFT